MPLLMIGTQLNPLSICAWAGHLSRMEAKDGSFGFDFAGTYTKIEPNELIEYLFGERSVLVRSSS
jgi:uncharacterized protein YndB with AHSA1/START domain